MTKYAVSWKLYSARRKVTLGDLIMSGKVSDYNGYIIYCEGLNIEPMTRDAFDNELKILSPPISTSTDLSETYSSSTIEELKEPEEITATVWLAGVTDTDLSIDDTKIKKNYIRKKKEIPTGGNSQE